MEIILLFSVNGGIIFNNIFSYNFDIAVSNKSGGYPCLFIIIITGIFHILLIYFRLKVAFIWVLSTVTVRGKYLGIATFSGQIMELFSVISFCLEWSNTAQAPGNHELSWSCWILVTANCKCGTGLPIKTITPGAPVV